ncbi:hypothetical protein IB265_27535 [Ensifer sp. ENS10]|uniref:hypothetical protein n=1 Tax=Ensifer sp. ENS10 TaxID=2769286 RepID=UPI00177BC42A|nr:hypothetical protein [Ensifer sp. ENS10]MBD9510522.1 hypothetical protein [Ensifer sp. ENS10]
MTNILFYLPVVSERYFEWFVAPLVRILVADAEIHIVAPPQWLATGVTERQKALLADIENIQWHILDVEDHESLRTSPADPEYVVKLIEALNPNYVFCRSADVSTPMLFPGKIRFMMESIIPPFRLRSDLSSPLMLDGPRLYDQGFMPDLTLDQRHAIATRFRPRWEAVRAETAPLQSAREQYLFEAGLPVDRKIIALPLNVEAQNNFFIKVHSITPSNIKLIDELASHLGDDFVLALTEHPLNRKGDPLVDQSVESLDPLIEKWRGKVIVVDASGPTGDATTSLVQHSDGVVICESKSFGYAAFFQKPIFRVSKYRSADWMNAYLDFKLFLSDILKESAFVPVDDEAMLWFGYHWANNVFALSDPKLTLEDIVDRFERPVNADRWAAGFDRIAAT